jgi:NhaP-type Na+/H+ or K+/H+ antiporter
MSMALVFATVVGVGYFIHWIWPALPMPSKIVIEPLGNNFPRVIADTATASVGHKIAAIAKAAGIALPMPAAFAIAAILCPTDAVAVSAITRGKLLPKGSTSY